MTSINRICSALTITVILASMALQASADTVFFDDFSDGSVTNDIPLASDGTPVRWTENSGGGSTSGDYDATSGDYVLTPATNNDDMSSTVVDITLPDFSIRTQVQTSSELGSAFVLARVQEPLVFPSESGYFGGIEHRTSAGGTRLILGRIDGLNDFTFLGGFPVLPFDVRTDDAVLQLDVIGNEINLWGWKAGDPMPDQPQLTAIDNTYSEGAMRIVNDAENSNIATFRYVHVADSIPTLSCDFNGDAFCNVEDIDALIMVIAAGPYDPNFDINGDGSVDLTDRDEWLAAAGAENLPSGNPYLVADFTLDGFVDGTDFIEWNTNKFSSTGKWSLADANGDGVTDGQDFIEWNTNKFMSSDAGGAVPEPGMSVFLMAALIGLAVVRRR